MKTFWKLTGSFDTGTPSTIRKKGSVKKSSTQIQHYSYEGGDGTRAIQDGQQIFVNNQAGTASQGQYTYQGDDGKTYSVSYTADENGYRPSADHLPTPPPVPAPIARALAYLATLPPQKENNNNNHNNNFNGNANKNNNRKF